MLTALLMYFLEMGKTMNIHDYTTTGGKKSNQRIYQHTTNGRAARNIQDKTRNNIKWLYGVSGTQYKAIKGQVIRNQIY